VTVEEIGSTQVTIFRQNKEESAVATLVVRGSTDNIMDDVERAIGMLGKNGKKERGKREKR
jgi:chaperonin GroEL (HSP60 family)